jgi:hypothetical protein
MPAGWLEQGMGSLALKIFAVVPRLSYAFPGATEA